MADKARKDIIKRLVAHIAERVHGSGIDLKWQFEDTRQGLWMRNSFHAMDGHGYYMGWADFSLLFAWDSPVTDFRLRFHGSLAQSLNRRKGLRELLESQVLETVTAWLKSNDIADCF